jgi:ParB/RepB/Spo0J family partition protein
MATTEVAPVSADTSFQLVPVKAIVESTENPRDPITNESVQDLLASVKVHGVLEPLLVRPLRRGHFELIAGARRFAAARLAELGEVPCIVRTMDDSTAAELRVVENLQRKDLTPLEEARGYQTLMTRFGYTAERISERIGMSLKYVYDRVKLLQLVPEAQTLLREGHIQAGHAILLARLTKEKQLEAIDFDDGGLFTTQGGTGDLFRRNPEKYEDALDNDPLLGKKAVSVRELQSWIDARVHFDPKLAAVDPVLFPETVEMLKFAEEGQRLKVIEITHDYHVRPEAKEGLGNTRIYGPQSWKPVTEEGCPHSVIGVVTVGPGRGESFNVCTAKDKCEVHWKDEIKRRAKQTKNTAAAKASGAKQERNWAEERRIEEQKQKERAARWKQVGPHLVDALADVVKKQPATPGSLLAKILTEAVDRYSTSERRAAEKVSVGKTADDLVRHLAFYVMLGNANEYRGIEMFVPLCKKLGVDTDKLLKEHAPRSAARGVFNEKKAQPKKAKRGRGKKGGAR